MTSPEFIAWGNIEPGDFCEQQDSPQGCSALGKKMGTIPSHSTYEGD